ncbi:hypothetical protein [Pantoea sp.]|uniref:winged helix-turn-helix domain-containing protein n=1 Tax=Pantoea sp. TaxID=69393 RepID=UPI0031DC9FA1
MRILLVYQFHLVYQLALNVLEDKVVGVNNVLNRVVVTRKDVVRIKCVGSLDCAMNILSFDSVDVSILLTERKKRLMLCLVGNVSCKRKIIETVWCENHKFIQDNNYHQLIHQFRSLLVKHNIPAAFIKTLPHYGVVLNVHALRGISKPGRSVKPPFFAGGAPAAYDGGSVLNIRFSEV